MSVGIFLSDDVVQRLPQPVKDALLHELQRLLQENTNQETPTPLSASASEEDKPADFSFVQANKFLEGCSEKTKKILRGIMQGNNEHFLLSDLACSLQMTIDDLSGVWGGLTKRTRTILGDKKLKIVVWPQNFFDENNRWVDAKGAVSKTTYASFRMALGL
jgi:hypothetical protein